ncbi:hypothetical protein ACOVAC_002671, partial [Enterococcus hirae]
YQKLKHRQFERESLVKMEEIKFPILFLKLFSSNNLNITKHIANVNLTEQKGKGIIKIEIFRFLYVILYFFDTRL